jgi:methylamine dehydrogenase accessory protein MauD
VPRTPLAGLAGETVELGGEDALGRRTLLFFLSPTCPVCKTLLPTLRRVVAEEPLVRLVYASDGEGAEHRAFVREHGLTGSEYVLSRDLGMRFEVSKLPFVVLLDAQGVVRAKGIANTREHLESLFEADRRGVGSIQQYLARETTLEVVNS